MSALNVGPPTATQVRLYISPFNESILPTVLAPDLRARASNISFHQLETFTENNYGYLDLPHAEAHTLRNKLNGAILRGRKMKVEEARPQKKRKAGSEGATKAGSKERKAKKVVDKDEVENGVLHAVDVSTDRHIKRGWTEGGSSKEKRKKREQRVNGGKDVADKEMLFRTIVPSNAVAQQSQTREKQLKKRSKREIDPSRDGKAIVVREFEQNTKFPTFLKANQASGDGIQAKEFVEGKGWVDHEGNVVEPITTSKRSIRAQRRSSEKNDLEEASGDKPTSDTAQFAASQTLAHDQDEQPETTTPRPTVEASKSPAPMPSTELSKSPEKSPHPLEALFKRPAAPSRSPQLQQQPVRKSGKDRRPAPIKTSFTFFESDDIVDDGNLDVEGAEARGVPVESSTTGNTSVAPYPPATPFTRRDLDMRGQRSAAPTPDTAAFGGRFRPPWKRWSGDDVESDAAREQSQDRASETLTEDAGHGRNLQAEKDRDDAQAEFEKHFWENRGEYSRAWKQRRREARKEVRQSENRRRAGR